MTEKINKDTIPSPDIPRFLDGIDLVSQKHTHLLTDLMHSSQRGPPAHIAHERPGLTTGASASIDLEKSIKQHLSDHPDVQESK
ncbi:MAG: hypothetical protein JW771_00325 [Candidatus Thermoplasmatota archaeon]|nr:hypothetical protein [Candidatus Thermoplasmatota archaeon]